MMNREHELNRKAEQYGLRPLAEMVYKRKKQNNILTKCRKELTAVLAGEAKPSTA